MDQFDEKVISVNQYRIAAVQMVSSSSVEENLQEAENLICKAVSHGAKLVLLPEYFAIIARNHGERLSAGEHFGKGPIQSFLARLAKEHSIWLVGGSVPLHANQPEKLFNSTLVYDPQGICISRYDKIHLFSFKNGKEFFNEGLVTEAGTRPVALDIPLGRVGLSICYDLRFPELYRALGEVDLLLVPAAFVDTTGEAHWEILLRARAIENQCYVLAAAQGGDHDSGRKTYGHSMLVDPWGRVVSDLHKGAGLVIGELCHEHIDRVRKSLPALEHRVLK